MDFLPWYHFKEEEFLDRIVTGNETWVAYLRLETKQQSVQWGGYTASTSEPKEAHQTLSVRKVMAYNALGW